MSGITPGQTYPHNPGVTFAGRKDAFHVPCVLCRISLNSKYCIDAGDHVTIENDCEAVVDLDGESFDGIVDPFLAENIPRKSPKLFWVFLVPSKVKNLTHTFDFVPSADAEKRAEPTDEDWNAGCRGCNS